LVDVGTDRWFGADELLEGLERVCIFCGGYGSGKTEVAVSFALHGASDGGPVTIADLDIVNPYFRSREVRMELRSRGVTVLVPDEQLVDADLPVIKPEIKGALESDSGPLVLDLGGDPVGAKVMASLADGLAKTGYDALLVVNSRRPFTDTPEGVVRSMKAIEDASGFKVTRLVVNSHLIDETRVEVIEEGIALAETVAEQTGVPIGFVAVERSRLGEFDPSACRYPAMVLDRLMLKPWENRAGLGSDRFKI
jgi:hypothetical protein